MISADRSVQPVFSILDVHQSRFLKRELCFVMTERNKQRNWNNHEDDEATPSETLMIRNYAQSIYDFVRFGQPPHRD
jgi:hypothetical protein